MDIRTAGALLYLVVFAIVCLGLAYNPLVIAFAPQLGAGLLLVGLVSIVVIIGTFVFAR